MDIATLRSAYRHGETSPTEQVERFLTQREDAAWAALWISRVSADRLRQQARALEGRLDADAQHIDSLPLYGVLFAYAALIGYEVWLLQTLFVAD